MLTFSCKNPTSCLCSSADNSWFLTGISITGEISGYSTGNVNFKLIAPEKYIPVIEKTLKNKIFNIMKLIILTFKYKYCNILLFNWTSCSFIIKHGGSFEISEIVKKYIYNI